MPPSAASDIEAQVRPLLRRSQKIQSSDFYEDFKEDFKEDLRFLRRFLRRLQKI
jgi:hypothetical protein